jgi:hypothetical protein
MAPDGVESRIQKKRMWVAIIKVEIRSGAYYDSVILMQLQRSLAEQPGIFDAGVVMGTTANKEVLAQSGLLVPEAEAAGADDLIIVVKGNDEATGQAALDKVDELVSSRRRSSADQDYHPHSMETAAEMLPDAQWVLVSVPGRYAAGVARQALGLNKHVFLYSDNVSLDDEISLKREADQKGGLRNRFAAGLRADPSNGRGDYVWSGHRGPRSLGSRQCRDRTPGARLDGARSRYQGDCVGIETTFPSGGGYIGQGGPLG